MKRAVGRFVGTSVAVFALLIVLGAVMKAPQDSASALEGLFSLIGNASDALVSFLGQFSARG